MEICLSNRLKNLVSFVTPGEKVADVGTDHGFIPIYLAVKELSPCLIASDVRQGPLLTARRNAAQYGVEDRISFRLSDGLAAVGREEVDTVILAGMGGETILHILEASPWSLEKKLILQPQSKTPELTAWLAGNGCFPVTAHLAEDAGIYYTIFLFQRGSDPGCDMWELLLQARDPLLAAAAKVEMEKLRRALDTLKRSNTERAQHSRAALEKQYGRVCGVLEEVQKW